MQGWARTIGLVGCSAERGASCVVVVGAGCVLWELSKSPLRVIVIALDGKVQEMEEKWWVWQKTYVSLSLLCKSSQQMRCLWSGAFSA